VRVNRLRAPSTACPTTPETECGAGDIDVVIVNWNAGNMLPACVRSVLRSELRSARLNSVVVVDNASTDDSLRRTEDLGSPLLRVLRNSRNAGFGTACNAGAGIGVGEWLLFLNPDTRVPRDALERAVSNLANGPNDVAVCGVRLVSDSGITSRGCARLPTWRMFFVSALGLDRIAPRVFKSHVMAEWDHAESRVVGHVIGAFYLIRRCVFERLGGFDERFFLYLEDLDLSQRIHEAGYRIYYDAKSHAYHKGGGTSEAILGRRLFYSLRSRLQYSTKHFPLTGRVLVALATLAIEPLIRFRRSCESSPQLRRMSARLTCCCTDLSCGKEACCRDGSPSALHTEKSHMKAPGSLTHLHLLAALRAELCSFNSSKPVLVLDAGCGLGALVGYLHSTLHELEPGRSFEIHGFDVADPGVQKPGFLQAGAARLSQIDDSVDWSLRLKSIPAADPWPFPDGVFDVVISNQVIEHVGDHQFFFSEMARVLRPGGVGIHCFPVKECVWEGHLYLPFVHWIAGHGGRVTLIRYLSSMGLGKFRQHRRHSGISLDSFAERHSDFLNLYTNYMTARQLLGFVKSSRLRASFAYSGGLYLQKLWRVANRTYSVRYSPSRAGFMASLVFWVLKRLSSITLRVEKKDEYRHRYG
jgi:N-acetylglucosaminyl-diphospho-decaprenol L-rhamnosyltransferase